MSKQLPFDPPGRLLCPDELFAVASAVGKDPSLWRDELQQTSRERTYADVYTDDHVGVWAISWVVGSHDTGYHDHDRSCGGVYVVCGAIRHEHLRLDDEPTAETVCAGDGFCFDATAIHRMRPEPGDGEPTITVHAYSPPLRHTGQYGRHDDGLLHRVATDATEQLVPHGAQTPPVREPKQGGSPSDTDVEHRAEHDEPEAGSS
jgi:hypothetical protein